MMYDEAQQKFKNMKEEDRFFFKTSKAKKRIQKHEGKTKIFDVKKVIAPENNAGEADHNRHQA